MRVFFPYFKVSTEEATYKRIMDITMATKGEWSCFGVVKKDGNNFLISDIVIPKQDNSAGQTTMDIDDLCDMASDMALRGQDTSEWHCWIHSHGDFNVFYSSTDNKTIDGFMKFFSQENSYLISIVVNHAGELICRVDINYPVRVTLGEVVVEIKKATVPLLAPPPIIDKERVLTLVKNSRGFYSIRGARLYRTPIEESIDVITKEDK